MNCFLSILLLAVAVSVVYGAPDGPFRTKIEAREEMRLHKDNWNRDRYQKVEATHDLWSGSNRDGNLKVQVFGRHERMDLGPHRRTDNSVGLQIGGRFKG